MSFDPSLRAAMEAVHVSGSTVSVVNCQVKAAKSGGEMEIMATSRTKVEATPHKFVVGSTVDEAPSQVKLSFIQ